MMIKQIRTSRGKITVRIPTDLHEITFGQLLDLQQLKNPDDLDVISIFSGIPKPLLQNTIDMGDIDQFGEAVMALAGQIKILNSYYTIPAKITFMLSGEKVIVDVIHNLAMEPAGAFMAARDIIADEIEKHIAVFGESNWQEHFQPSLNACCKVLAQYFYCCVTRQPYDEFEAEAFTEEIKKLKAMEALPLSRHFFTCYPNLSKRKQNYYQRLLQRLKRMQASVISKNSAISTPSMPWQAAI